jgi:hypothetical protein
MLKKIYNTDIFSDYSYVTFALSAVLMVASVLTGIPFLLASSVFLFSSMDAIGYFHLVWGGDQSVPANNQEARLISYRFIQTVFQAMITVILYTQVGIKYALAFNTMWWFGLCDMLYYVLLKQEFIKYQDMFWLWWTPAGILKSLGLLEKVSGVTMVIQSIIGLIIAGALILFM